MGDVQKLGLMLEEQSLKTAKAINRARRAEAKLDTMRTEMLNQLRQALDTRDGIIESFGEFGLLLRAPELIWGNEPPRNDDESTLFLRANGMSLEEIGAAGKKAAEIAKEALVTTQKRSMMLNEETVTCPER